MLTFRQIIDKIDRLEEAHVLLAALNLRLFSVLKKDRLPARVISRKAGTRSRETECLLDALVAMGALQKTGDLFSNTSATYKHLCDTSPHYKKGTVMLRGENRKEWSDLIQTIRDGRDPTQYGGGDDPEFRRPFTFAMHERSQRYARRISEVVTRKPVGRLIDLGGGPGSYSAAILRRDKKATATLLDRAAALAVARELWTGTKILQRFDFQEGDLFNTDYGKDFDTVLFSNILHIYNEGQNLKLFRKIHRSLKKGGRFILVDLFLDKNRTSPYEAALFSLTMLMFTATGRTYTSQETKELLGKSGFGSCKQFDLGSGSSLIEAIKK